MESRVTLRNTTPNSTYRFCQVSQDTPFSLYFPAKAGVPQGSILRLIFYTIYIADLPLHHSTSTFGTAILSSHPEHNLAFRQLQEQTALNRKVKQKLEDKGE